MKSTKFFSVSHHKKWYSMLLYLHIFACCDAQTTSPSSSDGLLCISECSTCPVICSPPPSPENSKFPGPPPPENSKSPPSPAPAKPYFRPPPAPPSFALPPLLFPPEASSPPSPRAPPPSRGKALPPPPPPASYYGGSGGGGGNLPAINQVPPAKNYSYPYYYYYASPSKAPASSLSFQTCSTFVLWLCIHVFFYFP